MDRTDASAELFNGSSVEDRTIHRRAIELAVWGMPTRLPDRRETPHGTRQSKIEVVS